MIDNFNIGKRLSFTKADLMCDTTKKEPNTTQNQLEQATENAAPDQFVNSNKNSNNKPDVKISYNLSEIKKFGFSDTEIEKYFNYFESKTPDGQILKGYGLKQGVVINGKTVTSLEELVDALGKNDTTKMAYSESDLFRYGFTNEEKNKYFNSFDSLTKGKKAYGLKEGIFINGKHISDLKELADALGKTDITLFTNYKRPPIFNPLNFSTKLDSSRPKEADSNKEQTFNTKISYNLSEIKKFGFSDTE
ncbi:MAG: hypothetical protein MJ231_05185, partial [bacterium]|nr:hypothetical protein [bacterium]